MPVADNIRALAASSGPSDQEIVERVRDGEAALFEVLMRRHNTRVYRTIRSIIRDEAEVEDLMQQTYLQAYEHLGHFEGAARFSTWLLRIALNEALMRARKSARLSVVPEPPVEEEEGPMAVTNPEQRVQDRQVAALLETAVDALPDLYRTAFMLREVEDLSTSEAAEVLGVSEEVIKTRLHRARGLVRESLLARAGANAGDAFSFYAPRCDRVVAAVFTRLLPGAPDAS
jgi:RNA polymerase sigma-70 factor (ECF subfamily)